MIYRSRSPLDLDRAKTIFGDKKRPHSDKRKKKPTRWGVVVEIPAHDVTILKVHCGKMTLKIYSKGELVLRVEVIVHNTGEYRWCRSLLAFPEIVARLKGILERFLNAVGCINACLVTDEDLEKLPQPAQIGQTRVGCIDLNKLRIQRVAERCSTSPRRPGHRPSERCRLRWGLRTKSRSIRSSISRVVLQRAA